MSYSVEQLPHCDLLRLILSTERFVLSARQLFNVGTDLRILYLTRGSIRCLQVRSIGGSPLCATERRADRSALGCLPKFQLSPRLNPVPTLGASEFIQVRCAQRNGERTRPSGSVGTRLFANISTKSRAPSGAYSPGLENSRTRDTPFM